MIIIQALFIIWVKLSIVLLIAEVIVQFILTIDIIVNVMLWNIMSFSSHFLSFISDKWKQDEVAGVLLEFHFPDKKRPSSQIQSLLINFFIAEVSTLKHLKKVFCVWLLMLDFETELGSNTDNSIPWGSIVIRCLGCLEINRRILILFIYVNLLIMPIHIFQVRFTVSPFWGLLSVKVKLSFKKVIKIEYIVALATIIVLPFVNK